MRKRKRIDLDTAIQHRYGESWLHAATLMRVMQPGNDPYDHLLEYRTMMVDELMEDALLQAMAQWWIPVPPMQARSVQRPIDVFGTDITIERRIRMIKPMALDGAGGLVLQVRWAVDPLDPDPSWTTYVPKYEDDPDAAPVRSPVSRPEREDPLSSDGPRGDGSGGGLAGYLRE